MDDEQEAQDVPELEVVRQIEVPFLDELLLAALGSDGEAYIPVTPFAQRLGLERPRRQLDRIRRDDTMRECLCRMQIATAGGKQWMQCLRVDMLALWLAAIRESAVKESIRPQLSWYKREAAKAILEHFRVLAIGSIVASSPDARLTAIVAQYDALMEVAQFLREHIMALIDVPDQLSQALQLLEALAARQDSTEQAVEKIQAKTQGLTPAQSRQIQEQISHVVEATANLDAPIRYGTLYGRIKHRFRVSSYKSIPEEQFENLMQFLRDELQRATDGESPEQGSLF